MSFANPINLNKPYLTIPIEDCGEPLITIPSEIFRIDLPHPYIKLGADYQGASPYCLRQSVLAALIKAQEYLIWQYPGWQLKIFDAYRPVEVQSYMVRHTFNALSGEKKIKQENLSDAEIDSIWQRVYTIWAIPSDNPQTPPPHSTGAAVDLTLVDETGKEIDMGGEIDELSDRSLPNYYADKPEYELYQLRRDILLNVMIKAGFKRHLGEWWHFSLGDQMWTWQYNQEQTKEKLTAKYGRIII
jgi:D-alanyl-D-alanine dipeptidase